MLYSLYILGFINKLFKIYYFIQNKVQKYVEIENRMHFYHWHAYNCHQARKINTISILKTFFINKIPTVLAVLYSRAIPILF